MALLELSVAEAEGTTGVTGATGVVGATGADTGVVGTTGLVTGAVGAVGAATGTFADEVPDESDEVVATGAVIADCVDEATGVLF